MLETDVGKVVANWLTDQRWTVYAEVRGPGGSIADIVATRGPLLAVVELKLGLGFEVIDQAMRWREHAHVVYAATPLRGYYLPPPARYAMERAGVGFLCVRIPKYVDRSFVNLENVNVEELIAPTFNRRASSRLRVALDEEHKTYAEPGASGNAPRWSPFKKTQRILLEYVTKNPGCSAKDVVENVEAPHITKKTNRRNVVRWLDTGLIPGVRIERDGRTPRLYPIEETKKT